MRKGKDFFLLKAGRLGVSVSVGSVAGLALLNAI